MRKCTSCGASTRKLSIEGWLVYGKSTLFSDDEESYGPIVPEFSINHEGYKQQLIARCACGFTAELSLFPRILICCITGEETSTVGVLFGQEVPLSEEGILQARLFNTLLLLPSVEEYLV